MTQDEQSGKRWKKLLLGGLFVLVFLLGVLLGCLLCTPGDTGDLTVKVQDEDGESINNAKVSLDGGGLQPVTGGDASAEFNDVQFGLHQITADAPQYQQNSTQVNVDEEEETVIIVLKKGGEDPSKPGG